MAGRAVPQALYLVQRREALEKGVIIARKRNCRFDERTLTGHCCGPNEHALSGETEKAPIVRGMIGL